MSIARVRRHHDAILSGRIATLRARSMGDTMRDTMHSPVQRELAASIGVRSRHFTGSIVAD